MNWLNYLGGVASILGAVFALMAWIKSHKVQKVLQAEKQRQNKKVTVVLQYGDQKHDLPVEFRRAELTRAEVLGRIGMIPMKETGKRFTLKYTNKPEFLQQINQINAENDSGLLTIPCDEEEFNQFDL